MSRTSEWSKAPRGTMREIRITRGQVAIVDDEDYEWLSEYSWYFDGQYAATKPKRYKNATLMHRLIMQTPKGFETDHINRAKLDNRKSNLRICTTAENQRNRLKQKNNTSGYKGVVRSQQNTWFGQIMLKGETLRTPRFKTPEEAAKAYEVLAHGLFGEFARTNS